MPGAELAAEDTREIKHYPCLQGSRSSIRGTDKQMLEYSSISTIIKHWVWSVLQSARGFCKQALREQAKQGEFLKNNLEFDFFLSNEMVSVEKKSELCQHAL